MDKVAVVCLRGVLFVLGLMTIAPSAFSHTMNTGRVTLNIVDHRVYVAATLPLRAFSSTNYEKIRNEYARAIRVSDGRSEVALQGILVMPEAAEHINQQPHSILVLGVAVFSEQPKYAQLKVEDSFRKRVGSLEVVTTSAHTDLGIATQHER
jgi:hypothetical protein